ncbi:MAG: pyridoxal-phosphate dependent enzyme, partial [Vicinamibacterales bacterium]
VLRLAERSELPAALVTASAGNHGWALAHAAALLDLPLAVYVPERAPAIKLQALQTAGARLIPCSDYDEAERLAREHAGGGRATYISPYAHPDVIAGAGTLGLEILQDDPSVDVVVVPVGGGGLISGVAIAGAGRVAIFGVEAEASCPFTTSLAAGHIVAIDVGPTLADGLAGNLDPDAITFDLVRQHVAGIVTVSEAEIRSAIAGLVAEERLIAEGAAAVAVAALTTGRLDVEGRRAAVVLSGANIDPDTLRQLI